jgi:hypothetical protein
MFDPIVNQKTLKEDEVTQSVLESPTEDTFAAVFKTYTPQLLSFFVTVQVVEAVFSSDGAGWALR